VEFRIADPQIHGGIVLIDLSRLFFRTDPEDYIWRKQSSLGSGTVKNSEGSSTYWRKVRGWNGNLPYIYIKND
jgi:hypothetical protein